MTSGETDLDQNFEEGFETIPSRKRASTTVNKISLTSTSLKKSRVTSSTIIGNFINDTKLNKSVEEQLFFNKYSHQYQNKKETKSLDSRSSSSSTGNKTAHLEHSSSFPRISQLPPNTVDQRALSHSESFTSITSEKVSMMKASEQSSVVQPLLTDFYQISMAYAYWKSNKHQEMATFDLFFRKNPFGGEYTIFAGLEECLKFIRDYKIHSTDIDYLRTVLPSYIEAAFFDYLLGLDMNDIQVYAVPEGTAVFPPIPLIRIEGPIGKTQLLETTLLTLVNFASLVATNAARFRSATAADKILLEFGLRRAQGPDGGLSASKYCYLGGFDGTSNVLAGKLYGIPVKGTHAHAYVSSYECINDLNERNLCDRISGEKRPFADLCLKYLQEVGSILQILPDEVNKGELSAFISYAIAFPTNFLALVDTYAVLNSGLPNFLAVARALHECNYQAVGLRLDSGDLAYLSLEVRKRFRDAAKQFGLPYFEHFTIVASNDINEDTLVSLEKQGHAIDQFGIGTHLVTCQRQPALGCVYKLVELAGLPRIKVSQDLAKITIPGKKNLYRIYGHDGKALCDVLTKSDERPPQAGVKLLCRHPFSDQRRAYVTPTTVQSLYKLYWSDGQLQETLPSLKEIREYAKDQLNHLRKDIIRDLNPTPYKVSLTQDLFQFMHDLWIRNVPIGELH